MSADEAKEYGIIDEVIVQRELANVARSPASRSQGRGERGSARGEVR